MWARAGDGVRRAGQAGPSALQRTASRKAGTPAVSGRRLARAVGCRASFWFYRKAGGFVRKKKPLDPVRQAQKNHAYRIGYLIALAGIACGFVLLELKPV